MKNPALLQKNGEKKCYNNVTFNIFWKSGLCPTDRNSCRNSLTVEELHFFKKYYDYLLQISELCADGYVLIESDLDFFKNQPKMKLIDLLNILKVQEKNR